MGKIDFDKISSSMPERVKNLNVYEFKQTKTDKNGKIRLDDKDRRLLAEFIVWNWAYEGVPYGNAEVAIQELMAWPADRLILKAREYDGVLSGYIEATLKTVDSLTHPKNRRQAK